MRTLSLLASALFSLSYTFSSRTTSYKRITNGLLDTVVFDTQVFPTMKLSTTNLLLLLAAATTGATSAFVPRAPGATARSHSFLSSTVSSSTKDTTTSAAKQRLLDTAQQLKSRYGVFLVEKQAKRELKDAVAALENYASMSGTGAPPVRLSKDICGEWELVCTTVTSQEGIDTSQLPSALLNPLQQIRDTITKQANKYVKVEQIIQWPADGSLEIDRIDHVIEYRPPEELRDVLDNLPEQLQALSINPLHVSRSKLVLVHKATVESTEDPLSISLSLKSIILNVAGTSTFLDPNGKDVTALNLPLGELLNSGTFETTYLDDTLRISRGQTVAGKQLRVFTRPQAVVVDEPEVMVSDEAVESMPDVTVDVDEAIDPEFDNDAPSDVERDDSL